jgi:2-methylaconitate cis-trans-isomerase PrpF
MELDPPTSARPVRVSATLMRGGTSKCWIFDAREVDRLPVTVEDVLLAAFGAADPRQTDGIGGATSTTSKALLVRPATDPDADIEYTFAQVGIGSRSVEWGSNCGNCATAAGLYALQAGLVEARPGRTTVRLRNTNTGAMLATTVDTPDGVVPELGSATVPGVSAGGVPVELSFLDPAGRTTGRLLPTGRAVDLLDAGGLRAEATLVDAGAPAAFVDPATLGLTGSDGIETVAGRIGELTRLRGRAAVTMGLIRPGDPVAHAVPKVGVVGPAADYHTVDGEPVARDEYDLAVRMVSMHAPHPAIGLTAAVALAAAAGVPGGLVARALPAHPHDPLRLGTPAGVVTVRAARDGGGGLLAVSLARAARRIAVAEVFVPLAGERRPAVAAEAAVAPMRPSA